MTTRWLFGDQLGPHFVEDHRGPLLLVESLGVFRRRRLRAVQGLDRLTDLDGLVAQEDARGNRAP
ncbi:hypothetical protein [Nocardioides sp.]|uniref:hypothetical protein n=1 Tax=Nocardioides sp. TaxID=35761 RepID=UPI0026088B80|nr:hypothetical protein [Nocardioides sp.]MCW2738650.1 cryptochrome/photolyase family protein [Nocardioides sp.]